MAETKKFYLDLAGLTHYDSKIKTYIANEITKVNNGINDYADVKDKATKSYNAWQSFLAGWPTTEVAPSLSDLAATKNTVDNLATTHYTKDQVNAIVGTPTEGKTVVGMISDLSTTVSDMDAAYKAADETLGGRIKAIEDLEIAKTYATKQSVTDLTTTVNGKADKATSLAGYGITDAYTKTEVDSAISDAKKEILGITGDETINQAYDTLKEVAEWIESDTSGAAAMQKDIADLKSNKADKATSLAGYGITDAYTKTEVDSIETNLEKYADDAAAGALGDAKVYVDDLKIADTYATKDEVTTGLAGKTSMSVVSDGVVFTQGEITVSPIANSEIDKLFATA